MTYFYCVAKPKDIQRKTTNSLHLRSCNHQIFNVPPQIKATVCLQLRQIKALATFWEFTCVVWQLHRQNIVIQWWASKQLLQYVWLCWCWKAWRGWVIAGTVPLAACWYRNTWCLYVYMCGGLCVHSVRCQSRAQKNVAALFFEILQSSNFIIIKFFLGAIKTVVCFVELGLRKPDWIF